MKNARKKFLWVLLASITLTILPISAQAEQADDFFSMSLEELMNVPVTTSTLTGSTRRIQPATVTTIESEDIRRSGARSLDELLLILVPNLQQRYHIDFPTHLGMRGINSDREDKYLILVNGRVMNERTYYGALSERDMPMLSDIHRVEVVRGGGSALYGPGAIAMVISITTESAKTFQGTEVTGRLGAIEEFYSGEFKHTWEMGEEEGLYFYAGASKYLGANGDRANMMAADWFTPHFVSDDWDNNKPYAYAQSGGDYHESFRPHRPKIKLHTEYNKEDMDVWVRFTQGGISFIPGHNNAVRDGKFTNGGMGYQQLTIYGKNLFDITDDLTFELALSYDLMDVDFQKGRYNTSWQEEIPQTYSKRPEETMGWAEEEYYAKGLFRWDIHEDHSLAIGGEYVYNKLGREGYGWPNSELKSYKTTISRHGKWETEMESIVGEYQWSINDMWTLFLGGRIDWHTYTDAMYSPRAALIWTPNEKDTWKFMVSRSTRTNLEEQMKDSEENGIATTPPELTDSYEVRYERKHTDKLWFAGSFFFQDRQPISWSGSTNEPLGTIHAWGLEGEVSYREENWRITLSHSFTTMYDSKLGTGPIISADGYGYGADYAHWDDHSTKLMGTWFVDEKLSIDSSLQVYWGCDGAEEYSEIRPLKHIELRSQPAGIASLTDREVYNVSAFLNVGSEYKWTPNTLVRVDLYNILGWLQDDLNQVPFMYNWYHTGQQTFIAPPAVSVMVKHTF